jgi:hypothetical protein
MHRSVTFYRAPEKNVVYVRNDKCASTFFTNMFVANGWKNEPAHNLDWKKDFVFGFIMDPYVRHVKGLVEDAVQMGVEKIMLTNLGIKFWQNLPWIGSHSMPMSVKFGEKFQHINWIPIDIGLTSTEKIVDRLLAPYNLKVNWNFEVDRNESLDYEKQLFHKFNELCNSQEKHALLKNICQDYQVYEQAVEKYKSEVPNV